MESSLLKATSRILPLIVMFLLITLVFGSNLAWANEGDDNTSTAATAPATAVAAAAAPTTTTAAATTTMGTLAAPAAIATTAIAAATTAAAAPAAYTLQYQAHVQSIGWQTWVKEGKTVGTTGKSLRMEAFRVDLLCPGLSGAVEYRAKVQGTGWQPWVTNGATAGTTGKALRIEALDIKLTDTLADTYDIYYRVHVQGFGWLGWAKNGQDAGSSGYGYRIEALEIRLVAKGGSAPTPAGPSFEKKPMELMARAHVQSIGWQDWVSQGTTASDAGTAGTTGRSLRMEALCLKITSPDYPGSVQYRAYCAGIGWQGWQKDGAIAGTTGQSRQMEAVQIQLTGKMADAYDIYYRVHVANVGWLDWTSNGASAGTTGLSLRMEAIQVRLVPKTGKAPGATTTPYLEVSYSAQADVAGKGWLAPVSGRGVVGTTGQSRVMEALKVQVGGSVAGSVEYCAYVQGTGWQGWVKNGAVAGTEGENKRIEALRVKLTGEMANRYDVYYRAYVQGIGWMGWAKNGANAGTAKLSLRMEAFEMVIVVKGAPAPGSASGAYRDTALPNVKIVQDMRSSFVHGNKPAAYQKYIVLHDTEGTGSPASVINGWDSDGAGVAAHFVIGTDGSIYQCVPLDKIAHHAGYGDTGHNKLYGVVEDGRDDMKGTVWVGSWASDYGMNAWSVGIELVHVGGQGDYPQAQLNALDSLIAYIDAYYGFQSTIIDHKAWRSGNSDTSPEFAKYLKNYQSVRHH